ncbi:MAG: hypothetical protein IV108_03320 [Burkholderiales bacterium]|nr:hypothetical protein [Burkholderiales bacterium]
MTKSIELDLAAAQVGMVLAHDVVNATGQTLAAAGMVVTESLLEGLRKREIERLTVCPLVDASAEAAALTERLEYLFRKAEADPIRATLRRALEQYRRGGNRAC